MCINFTWLWWLPYESVITVTYHAFVFVFFWTDENANLGTAMRYEEIGETMWFSCGFWFQISPCLSLWVIVRKYWVCPGTEINSLCISPQKNITSIRQRKTNDCQRNRQNSRNLSISHEMWWCLSVYCEEDISVLWSASFIHGKNVTCFFFHLFKVVMFTPTAKEKHLITVSCVFYGVMCNCDCGLFRVAYPAPLWQRSPGIFLHPRLMEREWCKI